MAIFTLQPMYCCICGKQLMFNFNYKGIPLCCQNCYDEYQWRKTLYVTGTEYYLNPKTTSLEKAGEYYALDIQVNLRDSSPNYLWQKVLPNEYIEAIKNSIQKEYEDSFDEEEIIEPKECPWFVYEEKPINKHEKLFRVRLQLTSDRKEE